MCKKEFSFSKIGLVAQPMYVCLRASKIQAKSLSYLSK